MKLWLILCFSSFRNSKCSDVVGMEPLWAVPKDSHSPSPAVGQVRGAEQPPAHGSEATSDEP